MPFADAGIVIASASGSEVEFTNGEQPGVRLTRAAATRSEERASGSKRRVGAKTVRGKTTGATEKKR